MKKLINTVLIVLITAYGYSQKCSKFYPFSEGTISEISIFDKKGKESGTLTYHVMKVTSSDGTKIASMASKLEDPKGNIISNNEFEVSCTGDIVSFDFKSMMNPALLERYKNMEYDISGKNLDLPNNLAVGQTLPDANMEMNISMSGINITMNIITKDRTVEAEENITTPAGSFDCYVISYTSQMQMSLGGMNQITTGKQWIAEGVGMVKQEDYNDKGKVTGSSVLTAFNQ